MSRKRGFVGPGVATWLAVEQTAFFTEKSIA